MTEKTGDARSRKKTRIKAQSTTYTYVYCWAAARSALGRAKASEEGSLYEYMTAGVFSAFLVEAYLNHLGQERMGKDWDTLERRLGPREKLLLLRKLVPATVDESKRPYQTLRPILKLRDSLAHGKTTTVKTDRMVDDPKDEEANYPQAGWKELCSPDSVSRMVEDAEAIVKDLAKQAGYRRDPFGSLGIGGSMATLPEDEYIVRIFRP